MQIVSSSLKNTERIILTVSNQKESNVWQMYDGLIRPRFFLAEAVRVGRTRTHLWVGCQLTVARGQGREEWRTTANEHEVAFWGNAYVPELHNDDGCTSL